MNFGSPFKNDDFEDIKRQEEYEHQKNVENTKAVGNFLYLYIMYGSIWLFSSAFTMVILDDIIGLGTGTSIVIGLIAGIVIFRVPYVKQNPFKSLMMVCFMFGLFIVASS